MHSVILDLLKRLQRDPFFLIPLMGIAGVAGLAGIVSKDSQVELMDDPKSLVLVAMIITTTFMAASMGLLRYLRSNDQLRRREDSIGLADLRKHVRTLLLKQEAGFGEKEKTQLKTALLTQIKETSSQEFLKQIEERVRLQLPDALLTKQLDEGFEKAVQRLTDEIDALGKRGNVNLVIGTLTALTGVGILGYIIFMIQAVPISSIQGPPPKEEFFSFMATYLPRLSLVFLIELFAYFFLRLYKASLGEIKFFQNELTNLELKFFALRLAVATNDKELRAVAVSEMCRTERNFVLKKDESTVHLEQGKIDREILTEQTRALGDLIEKIKK